VHSRFTYNFLNVNVFECNENINIRFSFFRFATFVFSDRFTSSFRHGTEDIVGDALVGLKNGIDDEL